MTNVISLICMYLYDLNSSSNCYPYLPTLKGRILMTWTSALSSTCNPKYWVFYSYCSYTVPIINRSYSLERHSYNYLILSVFSIFGFYKTGLMLFTGPLCFTRRGVFDVYLCFSVQESVATTTALCKNFLRKCGWCSYS